MNNSYFIDTHTHLYDKAFDSDITNVVERAKIAGVKKVILPGIDSNTHSKLLKLAEKFPDYTLPAIGVHPTSIDLNYEKELEFVYDNIESLPYCAIGEIGIDKYWSKEFISQQKIAFEQQLILSAKKNLPVIIHSREATEDIFDVLERVKSHNIRGVFHAFSGSIESFKKLDNFGEFMVGIGGVLTYKNASIAKVIESIPLNRIVLETDAPWLTPAPYRGKRNESSYIPIIAAEIAKIKGCSVAEVAEQTTINATKLFNIKTT